MVRQFIRSAIRDCAVCRIGALWPSSRPAITTASTPLAWISSATMYAANGVTNDIAVSSSGSVTCLRVQPTTTNVSIPTSTPPPAATTKSSPTPRTVTEPTAAARAVRKATSAVASLSSDSPSRIVTIRRGRPIRRPIEVAATASGGATTAPIASAIAHEMPGISQCTITPTPAAVNTTSPIESSRIARRLALKSTRDVCSAAAYSSGGSSPSSTTSCSRWTSGANGKKLPAIPATISSSGAGTSRRPAIAVSDRTATARTTRKKAISTGHSLPCRAHSSSPPSAEPCVVAGRTVRSGGPNRAFWRAEPCVLAGRTVRRGGPQRTARRGHNARFGGAQRTARRGTTHGSAGLGQGVGLGHPEHRVAPAELLDAVRGERQRHQGPPVRREGEHVRDHAAVGEHLGRLAQRVDERVVEATGLDHVPHVSEVRRPLRPRDVRASSSATRAPRPTSRSRGSPARRSTSPSGRSAATAASGPSAGRRPRRARSPGRAARGSAARPPAPSRRSATRGARPSSSTGPSDSPCLSRAAAGSPAGGSARRSGRRSGCDPACDATRPAPRRTPW